MVWNGGRWNGSEDHDWRKGLEAGVSVLMHMLSLLLELVVER